MSTDVWLVRHGATKGNLEHRYIGITDEPLLPESMEALRVRRNDMIGGELPRDGSSVVVYTSPLLRCIQTAEILFPDLPGQIVPDFRECDFGQFEYRNYAELNGNPEYQKYIDSGGTCGFPGGEMRAEFEQRTVRAFLALPEIRKSSGYAEADAGTVIIIAHGGTIMALLDVFSSPHRDYFSWQVKNGEGFRCRWTADAEGPMGRLSKICGIWENV